MAGILSPMKALDELRNGGIPYYLVSFSALDRFFRVRPSGLLRIAVRCNLVDLARAVPDLEFPAIDGIDALSSEDGTSLCFICLEDEGGLPERGSFPVMDLMYDPVRDRFIDPYDVYPLLRAPCIPEPREGAGRLQTLIDAAVLVSRYHYDAAAAMETLDGDAPSQLEPFDAVTQRNLITELFTGPTPWRGLRLLMRHGVIEQRWPVFSPMDETDQSKGFHPEGNVWVHSLETLRYRKTHDLTLSLALFLHDSGKPYAKRNNGNRFDGHAEIGAKLARKFLQGAGFDRALVEDVFFLVKYHMIPGALPSLPTYRTDNLMSSQLFPVLLELYRCDLNSSFRGPEGYYKACKVYRSYLKNVHNPFRAADGKKLVQLYVQ